MFWKKKEVKTPTEAVNAKYDCVGVNYLEEIEKDGENLDGVKEELFAYFQKAKKVYTKADINLITDKLGYDVWNSFIWLDTALSSADKKVSISLKYRWLGVNPDLSTDDLTVEPSILEKHLNKQDFYTRVDIQDVAKIVGFDVYNRSNWQTFTKTEREYPSMNLKYEYYAKGE